MPESLFALALLACPVGMGAMMWMMNRGNKAQPDDKAQPGDVEAKRGELAGLQAQIDQLRAEQIDPQRAEAGRPTVRPVP